MSNRKVVVRGLPGDDRAGPEEETRVPCPVCLKGMVSPAVAARIRELLKEAGDGPSSPSVPQVVTETMPHLPDPGPPPSSRRKR